MAKKGVFLITNTYNNKRFVGVSEDIQTEWFNIKRDVHIGLGIRKMREDYEQYGEKAFNFEILLESDNMSELHRLESETAYKYDVWHHGYNTEHMLNYKSMSEEQLALEKLKFYKFIENVDDGKYMFTDLLHILGMTKNDLQILLREITIDEMQYFKKQVYLRNKNQGIMNLYIQVKSF